MDCQALAESWLTPLLEHDCPLEMSCESYMSFTYVIEIFLVTTLKK